MSGDDKRIGLLFVHGMGEQKRFDHLRGTVRAFAELMKDGVHGARVTLVDRTEGWKTPPGAPDAKGPAPMTLSVVTDGKRVAFDCHEVWWADLGARSGPLDSLGFWFWGLGYWCAPIFNSLDYAKLERGPGDQARGGSGKLSTMPAGIVGDFLLEAWTRIRLLLAAFGAVLTACTWTLAKRLIGWLSGHVPGPTLMVQYVGDVRAYERRAIPGDTSHPDPGFPARVGIRRRMVTEMVAMAERDCDGWFVIAHSLGTLVAYNGLTEIGHALPNYLPEAQWKRLPLHWTSDAGCNQRPDLKDMMPGRPPWLAADDVLNRPLLFGKLRGFLTYGSPLDKFASLWPLIVSTATDRNDTRNPFADTQWINLAAPSDPVAGRIDQYGGLKGVLPDLTNISTAWSLRYLLAHIDYFRPKGRTAKGDDIAPRSAIMQWLLGGAAPAGNSPKRWLGLIHPIVYSVILAALLCSAAAMVALGGGMIEAWRAKEAVAFPSLAAFLKGLGAVFAPLLGLALALPAIAGLSRWIRDAWRNARLAQQDKGPPRTRAFLWAMAVIALVVGGAGVAFAALGLIADLFGPAGPAIPPAAVADAAGWLERAGVCASHHLSTLMRCLRAAADCATGWLPDTARAALCAAIAMAAATIAQSAVNFIATKLVRGRSAARRRLFRGLGALLRLRRA